MNRSRLGLWLAGLALCVAPLAAHAEADADRFSAGGYFRIMTRPDFQGGSGRLGVWNLSGRLLNEGPYGMLNLRLNLIQPESTHTEPWAAVNARIEGGSVQAADTGNGNLANFRISQLYLEAGNILFEHVTWRIGSLDYYAGDLGLYDMRPAELFYDAVGVSALYQTSRYDLLIGLGDAGYGIRGTQYDTIFTGGVWGRLHLTPHLEFGLGAQGYFEPGISGNSNAPYQTPNVNYEAYYRHEVAKDFLLANPGQEDQFPGPDQRSSRSGRLVWYLGFGGFGPIRWDSLYGYYMLKHPDNFYTENYNGRDYTIFIHDLTDQRTELLVGNEMQLTVLPGLVDAVWSVLYGQDRNGDNAIASGEDNRNFMSTVLRVQTYATDKVHVLVETSLANEHSLNGNLWREHVDSVFTSTTANGNTVSDARGLQYGDTSDRNTWQGKGGLVFNPGGKGIYTRPSLRLLYGVQYSNVQASFGNNFSTSLSQYNRFPGTELHWHHVVALEAEGWF